MSKLDKLKSLIPLHELEQSAQQQIYNALNLDFLIKLAIMPDCHTGYTLPIGGVAYWIMLYHQSMLDMILVVVCVL